jgi:hypothetical protein
MTQDTPRVDYELIIPCSNCGGAGKVCTFTGHINSSEDTYERCKVCKGKKIIFKEWINLMALPPYAALYQKCKELEGVIEHVRTA